VRPRRDHLGPGPPLVVVILRLQFPAVRAVRQQLHEDVVGQPVTGRQRGVRAAVGDTWDSGSAAVMAAGVSLAAVRMSRTSPSASALGPFQRLRSATAACA
jgi:hypothetical protein